MPEQRKKRTVYDLKRSPYNAELGEYTFYFSTELRRDKFMERVTENRKAVSEQLSKRYKFPIKLDILSDIYLYINIEDRGFYFTDSRGEYLWPGMFRLNGAKLTKLTSQI